jgi:hypothetical protein
LPSRVEVAARGHRAVDAGEAGGERLASGRRGDLGLEVPVGRGDERHPLALAVDDQPGRDRLHAAGRQPGMTFFHSTGETS